MGKNVASHIDEIRWISPCEWIDDMVGVREMIHMMTMLRMQMRIAHLRAELRCRVDVWVGSESRVAVRLMLCREQCDDLCRVQASNLLLLKRKLKERICVGDLVLKSGMNSRMHLQGRKRSHLGNLKDVVNLLF